MHYAIYDSSNKKPNTHIGATPDRIRKLLGKATIRRKTIRRYANVESHANLNHITSLNSMVIIGHQLIVDSP